MKAKLYYMGIKSRCMNRKGYWIVKHIKDKIFFVLKRKIYIIKKHLSDLKDKTPLKNRILIETIKQIIMAVIILSIFYGLDFLWRFRDQILPNGHLILRFSLPNLDFSDFSTLLSSALIAMLGVTGVFLGLYFSNMATVYSSRYANAPSKVRILFENETITNKGIKDIIQFIVICCISLFLIQIDKTPAFFTTSFLFYLGIQNVVAFARIGKRSFRFSDVSDIATPVYMNICDEMKLCCQNQFLSNDPSFQNHHYKQVADHFDTLSKICDYYIDSQELKGISILNFTRNNIKILGEYWSTKNLIPYNSKWFPTILKYKKWFTAKSYEVQIALKTGTSIQNEEEQDIFWFEKNVFAINKKIIKQLINSKKYDALYEYLINLKNLPYNAIKGNSLSFFLNELEYLQNELLTLVDKDISDCNPNIPALFDALMLLYVEVVLGIQRYYSEYSFDNEFSEVINPPVSFAICPSANSAEMHSFLLKLDLEKVINDKQITPSWYIRQQIAKADYEKLIKSLHSIQNIYSDIAPSFAEQLIVKEKYAEALVVISRIAEIKSKCDYALDTLVPLVRSLQNMHIDKEDTWEEWTEEQFAAKIEMVATKLPDLWVRASVSFTFENINDLALYPDMLGHCYNVFCDSLIDTITSDRLDVFEKIFSRFLPIVALYHEITRKEIIEKRREYNDSYILHLIAAPFLEYCTICGYALIWGAITNNNNWKRTIESNFMKFLEAKKENKKEVLKYLIDVIKITADALPGISERDLLRSSWEIRINGAIKNCSTAHVIHDHWGHHYYKTDDAVINAFLRGKWDHNLADNAYEVFLNLFVNPFVDEDDRFYSKFKWENKIDERKK
ncbi:MAG: hypothetical protein E7385_08425 [Ruminococcaceae bacterium]|nr:hypothetical protein [Oscillospiraceae bacterium]